MQPGTVLVEQVREPGRPMIAGLYVRMIYEQGPSAESILVVTFTNAATAELRRGSVKDSGCHRRHRARQEDPAAYAETDIPPPETLSYCVETFSDCVAPSELRPSGNPHHPWFCKRLLETFPFESEAEGTVEYGFA